MGRFKGECKKTQVANYTELSELEQTKAKHAGKGLLARVVINGEEVNIMKLRKI